MIGNASSPPTTTLDMMAIGVTIINAPIKKPAPPAPADSCEYQANIERGTKKKKQPANPPTQAKTKKLTNLFPLSDISCSFRQMVRLISIYMDKLSIVNLLLIS